MPKDPFQEWLELQQSFGGMFDEDHTLRLSLGQGDGPASGVQRCPTIDQIIHGWLHRDVPVDLAGLPPADPADLPSA